MIEAVDLGDAATIDALDAVRFTAAGEQAARDVLAGAASRDARWAATWLYASSGSDPAPLRSVVLDPDPSIRALAAAGLVALGDRSGLDALVTLIPESTQLAGSHPPLAIGDFAVATSERYVEAADEPASATSEDDSTVARDAWRAWLAKHAGELTFDATTRTWRRP